MSVLNNRNVHTEKANIRKYEIYSTENEPFGAAITKFDVTVLIK